MSLAHELTLEERIQKMRQKTKGRVPPPEVAAQPQQPAAVVKKQSRIEMKEAADRLNIGFKELFNLLRDTGHFIKEGKSHVPKSELVQKKYFETELKTFCRGHVSNPYIKVYATSAGMSFLAEVIHKHKETK